MTDQQRGDCLGVEGHPVLQTPSMDALAHNGTRFGRCYSTCPVCIPARRSLMSGQFPATHGMVGYRDGMDWDAPTTMPQALADAGYQTAIVGRSMHLHPGRKRYGFQEMTVHGLSGSDYEQWLEHHAPASVGAYNGTGVMHNDSTARPWHLDETLHTTNWTVREALRFLDRRDPSCPFFLIASFLAPHPPLVPPQCYYDRYMQMDLPDPVYGDWASPPDKRTGDTVAPTRIHLQGERLRQARAAYFGLINHIDDQIRLLLNPVTGIQKMTGNNTVVLFTSDHGEMLGDHYMWRKSQPYEPSARVPLLVSAPPKFGFASGHVVDAPVCLEDIMPTVLDVAGVAIPSTCEGRSLLPFIRGEGQPWREFVHIEYSGNCHALTDGREKFIWLAGNGSEQFFDLTADPTECRNLIADPSRQSRIAEWRGRLVKHLKDRPEGFSDGQALIPGRPYPTMIVR
jgi:arylsulfatase A-like enzyme